MSRANNGDAQAGRRSSLGGGGNPTHAHAHGTVLTAATARMRSSVARDGSSTAAAAARQNRTTSGTASLQSGMSISTFSSSTLKTTPQRQSSSNGQWSPPGHSPVIPTPLEAVSTVALGVEPEVEFDIVHWQSSQTANHALNSLLKEASSESFRASSRASCACCFTHFSW